MSVKVVVLEASVEPTCVHEPVPLGERSTMKPSSTLELSVQVKAIWSAFAAGVATRLLGAAGGAAVVALATGELRDGPRMLLVARTR